MKENVLEELLSLLDEKMSATKLYPSAPLETVTTIDERIEEQTKDVSTFNVSVNSFKEKISYFKDDNEKKTKTKEEKNIWEVN